MKHLYNRTIIGQEENYSKPLLVHRHRLNYTLFFYLPAFLMILITGCQKQDASKAGASQANAIEKNAADTKHIIDYTGLSQQTQHELQQARAASAKYQNINNAFKDGYQDIHLVMPNMGYHFMKLSLVDSVFDVRQPELLVYNKRQDGSFVLGAVEYAVPIDPKSPHTPPEGFTGTSDVWDFNTNNTGLWTLHAWVWKFDPSGVFNPTNPLVIVR